MANEHEGRHPDTVEKGIWVVQKVDYHAVARRSRALEEVALGVTLLSSQYGEAIAGPRVGGPGRGRCPNGHSGGASRRRWLYSDRGRRPTGMPDFLLVPMRVDGLWLGQDRLVVGANAALDDTAPDT